VAPEESGVVPHGINGPDRRALSLDLNDPAASANRPRTPRDDQERLTARLLNRRNALRLHNATGEGGARCKSQKGSITRDAWLVTG
jgi:hypothetical protein